MRFNRVDDSHFGSLFINKKRQEHREMIFPAESIVVPSLITSCNQEKPFEEEFLIARSIVVARKLNTKRQASKRASSSV